MLIAVDTNILLDLAAETEAVVDAFETVRKRLPDARLLAPPTVLHELAIMVRTSDSKKKSQTALVSLSRLRAWGIEPSNLVPVGHGIVERIADQLRREKLIPTEERNDSLVLAEASLLGCSILLTSDAHLRAIQFERLTLLLQAFDVASPIIATPREIVRKFYR